MATLVSTTATYLHCIAAAAEDKESIQWIRWRKTWYLQFREPLYCESEYGITQHVVFDVVPSTQTTEPILYLLGSGATYHPFSSVRRTSEQIDGGKRREKIMDGDVGRICRPVNFQYT